MDRFGGRRETAKQDIRYKNVWAREHYAIYTDLILRHLSQVVLSCLIILCPSPRPACLLVFFPQKLSKAGH